VTAKLRNVAILGLSAFLVALGAGHQQAQAFGLLSSTRQS
jgi:hypothetical protein